MRCEEIMTRTVAMLPIEATVLEAARLMAEDQIGFIPLIDQSGRAVGTATDRDLVVLSVAKGDDPRTTPMSKYGGNAVICCQPDDDDAKARKLMQEHRIQRILVCDKAGRPVGVISLQDLAAHDDEKQLGETIQEVKQGAPSVH